MEEIWKDIKGFEGVCQISNMGRLRSFRRGTWCVRSLVNSKGGYLSVELISGSKRRYAKIHRLVYETFIGEIPQDNKLVIHHINHNKQDNRVDNLTLLTRKEHALEHHRELCLRRYPKRNSVHHLGHNNNPNIKGMVYYNKFIRPTPIGQYSIDGVFVASFPSCEEASRITGVCARNIHQVAHKTPFNKDGKIRKQAGGYIWRLLK